MIKNLFDRYSPSKLAAFTKWLQTPHGKEVYGLFVKFATTWRDAGHDKCGYSLILNRLRWEMTLKAKWQGYKVRNEYGPLMARQLVQDDPTFDGFFAFHRTTPYSTDTLSGHPDSAWVEKLG